MTWPLGYGRTVLDEVDSTLSEAARRFPTLTGPEWILALHQTAARGRRGRAWTNPRGNFAANVVLRDVAPVDGALRSFTTSLALFDTVVAATGRADGLALKWPNDVLLNGGKLAGILLETLGNGGLSIGIGVNLASAPDAAQVEERALRPVSLMGEAGARVTPEEFLDLLAESFAKYEAQLMQFGFAPIRSAWLARAAKIGEVITARLPNQEVTGTFETVDEQGQLILTTAQGPRAIAAGDVFF